MIGISVLALIVYVLGLPAFLLAVTWYLLSDSVVQHTIDSCQPTHMRPQYSVVPSGTSSTQRLPVGY
jgi:hypothetical protein